MKLSIKALLTTVALTVAFATPVFATETDLNKEMQYINNHFQEVGVQISSYLKTDDGCGAAAKVDHGTHARVVDAQLLTWVAQEESNYIDYLKRVVDNKKETERIKKEVLDNYTNLSKVNAQMAAMVPAAAADYNAAVADRMAAEVAIVNAQTTFLAYNNQLNATVVSAMAYNAAIDR